MTDFTMPRTPGSMPPDPPRVKLPLASRDSTAFTAAMVVSIVLHAALVWSVWGRTIVSEHLWSDEEEYREYSIQRTERDTIRDETIPMPFDVGAAPTVNPTGPGAASGAGSAATLATASRNILTGSANEAPSGGQAAPLVGGREWRRPNEVRPGPVGGTSGIAAPRVDLPDLVTRTASSPKIEIEFKGDGRGTGAQGGSTAAGTAEEMLAGIKPGPGLGGGSGAGTGVGPGDATKGVGRAGAVDGPGGRGGGGPGTGPGGGLTPPTHKDIAKAAQEVPINVEKLPDLPVTPGQEIEHLDEDFDYAVTVFDDRRGMPYARVDISPKRTLRKLRTMPRDVVILIDVSGSVMQPWVTAVTKGVRDALSSLNEGDRFNIVMFKDKPYFFSADKIQPWNAQSVAAAQEFLTGAQSGGYTDVNQALGRLMVRDVAINRVYDLILISDGVPTKGVVNTRELINLVTRDNDLASSIYCVGVGDKQNRQLLDFLSYRNRGFSVYAETQMQAPGVIRDLMSRLRFPIMKDVRFSVAGLPEDEVFPRDVPNIHQGETFSLFGRYDKLEKFTMRLSGHNGQKPLDLTFTRDLKDAARGDRELAQQWAFMKLHHLYSEVIRRGETPEFKAMIERHGKEYGLKTLY